jgi:dehydrogenase/reductase SDR family protein 12
VRNVADLTDVLLEATIAGSWSRAGILARRAIGPWPEPPRIDGATVVVTGASSGIGRAAAGQLAALGAEVVLVGRDRARLAEAADASGGEAIVADLVERAQLDELVRRLSERKRIDGVVHNAGALFPERRTDPDGVELTVATHVLAPFRLARALKPRLAGAVSVVVSSGGMYTARLEMDQLEMPPGAYRGAVAYARAKRAQVVLAGEWARRGWFRSYSMHPGWVATPGVSAGLPRFSRLGPALRTPDEGADTITWLVACGLGPEPPAEGFYFDRRRRGEHYRPGTAAGDSAATLWDWCEARA